jgi:hypothetical protein
VTIGRWLFAIACAGCEITPRPYEVFVSAHLMPGTLDIEGPLEIAGTGEARPAPLSTHLVAAYHVRLPDDTPRRLRLFAPGSCDTPHDDVVPLWNLGQIRRVGDETHFFATGISIGNRTLDIDVVTRFVFVHLDPDMPYGALDMMAVVQDLANDDDDQYGPGSGLSGGRGSGPGDWLACGVFTLPQ